MKKFILSLLCLVMLATPVALKADTNTQSNTSGCNTNITGVSWTEKTKRYECHLTGNNKERIRKTFSVSKYGNKARALQHARIWITAMKREYGYL